MNEQKFCKDCKFYKKAFFSREDLCYRKGPAFDIVTGKSVPEAHRAYTQRIYRDECGPDARYFELKEMK